MKNIAILILAAGRSSRMRSKLPKLLHCIAGKPLLHWLLDTVTNNYQNINIIVGPEYAEIIKQNCNNYNSKVNWLLQQQPLGSGHAVKVAITQIKPGNYSHLLVLNGDVPFISITSLTTLLKQSIENNSVGFISTITKDPSGLGRVIRDTKHNFVKIIESKDANSEQQKITEINAGIYCFPFAAISNLLNSINANNKQKEYYLTDAVNIAAQQNYNVTAVCCDDAEEFLGVNNKYQLMQLERLVQQKIAKDFMLQGVTIVDQMRVDFRGNVTIGADSILDVNTLFIGKVAIGKNCTIGANSIIINSKISDNVVVEPFSHIEDATIAEHCIIGPYARLRKGSNLAPNVKIGNFVEIKNINIGAGSKACHLSYLGDAEIGSKVNIGAGTITCNYDGKLKHKTIIGDGVFVGSDTQIVAPVTIASGSKIAAGTTVLHDVPENALALTKKEQQNRLLIKED